MQDLNEFIEHKYFENEKIEERILMRSQETKKKRNICKFIS